MKKLLLISVLFAICAVPLTANYQYSAPEFMQAYYDLFSQNYLNALAAGRGNTGVAKVENIENAVINPAGFSTEHSELYTEIVFKPSQDEFGHTGNNNYLSENPLSMIGLGFTLVDDLSTGIYYSHPKNIKYDNYAISLPTGAYVNIKSEYTHHRIGFVNSYNFGIVSMGADVNYNIHNYDNFVVMGSTEKIDMKEAGISFATGAVISTSDNFNIGLAYNHSEDYEFTNRHTSWDVTIPAKITAGLSYRYNRNSVVNMDVEHRLNSQMSDDYEDIDILKLGFEQQIRNSIIRIGGIYIPSTFNGVVDLPTVGIEDMNTFYEPDNYNGGIEVIGETDQTFLTVGYTLNLEDFTFNLAAMQALNSEVNTTQFYISLGVNLTDFDINNYTPGSYEDDE